MSKYRLNFTTNSLKFLNISPPNSVMQAWNKKCWLFWQKMLGAAGYYKIHKLELKIIRKLGAIRTTNLSTHPGLLQPASDTRPWHCRCGRWHTGCGAWPPWPFGGFAWKLPRQSPLAVSAQNGINCVKILCTNLFHHQHILPPARHGHVLLAWKVLDDSPERGVVGGRAVVGLIKSRY